MSLPKMLVASCFFTLLIPTNVVCVAQARHAVPMNASRWNQPDSLMRLPKIAATESWRFVARQTMALLPSNLFRTQETELDVNALYRSACQMINQLATDFPGKSLTRDELRPTWAAIQRFHEHDESTYEQLISLYKYLSELELPAVDRLETIRLLGQHRYLQGNYAEAIVIFSEASEIQTDHLSEIDRELCHDALGNILYRQGLSLAHETGSEDATIETFRKIVDQSAIAIQIDPSTLANIHQRLGRLYYVQRDFAGATDSFAAGIKTIDQPSASRADKEYRISLEVELTQSRVMAENVEDPDYAKMLRELNSLKKKLSGKGYPDFDFLLRTRIVIGKNLDDDDQYVDLIEELREFFKTKHSVTRAWERIDKIRYLDASALLIKHLLEQKDEKSAGKILVETKDLAAPASNWYYRFPLRFVDTALEKSVLDEDDRK